MVQMEVWNKAAILKLLWNLAGKNDKLWVRWVHTFYVKEMTMWTCKLPNKACWNLKKILNRENENGGWRSMEHQGKFSINEAYQQLKGDFPKVPWS